MLRESRAALDSCSAMLRESRAALDSPKRKLYLSLVCSSQVVVSLAYYENTPD
jgi:hypothetical protein